jgi:hypothetical protein
MLVEAAPPAPPPLVLAPPEEVLEVVPSTVETELLLVLSIVTASPVTCAVAPVVLVTPVVVGEAPPEEVVADVDDVTFAPVLPSVFAGAEGSSFELQENASAVEVRAMASRRWFLSRRM